MASSALATDTVTGRGRNIVLCYDGTSNTFSPDLTNLPTLFSLLSADPSKQLCWYDSGVGTKDYANGASLTGLFGKASALLDEAVAFNLGNHVQSGYRFLMETYQPADKIFLFGFSRGAYTARALAGMLQSVGLLLPGNDGSVSLAYNIYAKKGNATLYPGLPLPAAFKDTFSRDVRVHFVGTFDTVSSVGAIIPRTLPFANGTYMIENFRHALSLDERRARFSPQIWTTPSQVFGDEVKATDVLEVWFCGVHSNVGGGFTASDGDSTPRLSHLPLRWMIREAFTKGLELDAAAVRRSGVYGRNPEFAAFVDEQIRSDSKVLHQYCDSSLNPSGADKDIVGLVQFSSRPLPEDGGRSYFHKEALAPRGDALSFSIKAETGGSFQEKIGGFFARLGQRAQTAAWWILEVLPTLKIIWNDAGQTLRWTFIPNLGRPRKLPSTPTVNFHQSVRLRLEAKPADFANYAGDNKSIEEHHYKFKATLPGGGNTTIVYVD